MVRRYVNYYSSANLNLWQNVNYFSHRLASLHSCSGIMSNKIFAHFLLFLFEVKAM